MQNRILIHSLIFSPDAVSTAYLYSDIALKLKDSGYDVVVLTTTPHYNIVDEQLAKQPLRWKLWGICKISIFNGIRVYHIPQRKYKNTVLRIVGFAYWHVISFIIGLSIRHVNVILSPSPPLTIGLLNVWLAKIKHCKVVYNVQEIYPDILKMRDGLTLKILQRIEKCVYNESTAITTIDKVFYDNIKGRFIDLSKLLIIPNFVDTDLYKPSQNNDVCVDNSLFPKTDSIKVLYAGNIGFAQDWETLISLAKNTADLSVEYFVIGEGVMKTFLEEQKRKYRLGKIHILQYQNRELMPSIIAYSDIQFIFMNPNMDMQGFPSKVYTVMACAKPLLVSSGASTPIVNFLKGVGCAKLVVDDDIEVRICEMSEWLRNVTVGELSIMGEKGLKIITEKYSKNVVTKQYVDLISSILKR